MQLLYDSVCVDTRIYWSKYIYHYCARVCGWVMRLGLERLYRESRRIQRHNSQDFRASVGSIMRFALDLRNLI